MKTQSQQEIAMAQELLSLITVRKDMEKRESELKEHFKHKITDGVLEAGPVIIMVQKKSRTSPDKVAMETSLGKDVVKQFEKVTEYEQVTVEAKRAA